MNIWITTSDVKFAKQHLGRNRWNKITKEAYTDFRLAGFTRKQSKLGAIQMAVEESHAIIEATE